MRIIPLLICACLLLFLSSCASLGAKNPIDAAVSREQVFAEYGPDPGVFFCKKDNCSRQLENALLIANSSIHCAFYDLDLENIIKAIGRKSREVDARVVLDDEPYNGAIGGSGVVIEDKSSRMHNKFCVIDSMYVWSGSFNPTGNDNDVNENNGILMSSYYLSKNYEEEFRELWSGQFSGGAPVPYPSFRHNAMEVESLFCPEDHCEKKVAAELSLANKSIYFMVFSFTSEEIADAILFNTNTEVKGLFDSSQAGSRYSQHARLLGFGLDVRKDKGKGKLHHKVFIIDNETVITGSYNPTSSGSESNDENVLILHDKGVAERFSSEFFLLWNTP